MARPDSRLLQAFQTAVYAVQPPGGEWWRITMGVPALAIDAAAVPGTTCWALIAAGCPRSAPWPQRLNAQRLALLRRRVQRAGWVAWPARGADPAGTWAEDSWLVFLPRLRDADALACRFGQHAIVCAGYGAPALLRCYGPGWAAFSKPFTSNRSAGGSNG